MSTRTENQALTTVGHTPASLVVLRLIRRIETGQISVELPNGRVIHHRGAADGPAACLVLHRWRAIWRLLIGGDVDWADAFVDGDWSSPDVVALIELADRNRAAFEGFPGGWLPGRIVGRLR